MNQTKTDRPATPVDEQLDPEVISFRAQFDQKSPLDELVREGARRMLQSAIDAEVEAFVAMHQDREQTKVYGVFVVENNCLHRREATVLEQAKLVLICSRASAFDIRLRCPPMKPE